MSNTPNFDDPFADAAASGRTFLKPTPGVRAAGNAPRGLQAVGADMAGDIELVDSGLNPLVAVANRLLAVVPQIRATSHLTDAASLRDSIAQSVRSFEAQARAKNISPERILAARYVLCTLIDETAAGMPWGSGGQWGRHSLLTMFHNETEGGEKVFLLMAKLAQNPKENRDLLELIHAALSFGFEGRYRVIDGGRAQLESVRERLAQILRKERGDYPQVLAQHWRGTLPKRRRFLSWLPLWVTATSMALLLTAAYMVFARRLNDASDPTYARILGLRLTSAPQPTARPLASSPRLAAFLSPEIKAGLVAVRDEVNQSVITVRGDGLFQPASAQLTPEREALMRRIAEAASQVPGTLLVTGHTDNVPIRTARFPSNWHLSEERARAVRDILVRHGIAPTNVKAEGRADGEPTAANDSAINRALNRRVVITLSVPVVAGKAT